MINQSDLSFIEESLPFFSQLSSQEKSSLIASIIKTKYESNHIMHSGQGDCTGLFLVKSGLLRAFIISETGKELTVFRLFEYDLCIFSAVCILKNIAFDILVEASENSEVYIIPSNVYNDLTHTNIRVMEFTNNVMQSRFSEVMDVLHQTIFLGIDQRLSMFLLDLINIQGSNTLKITHEEIANNIASAREVVSRILKEFEKDNILKVSRGKIIIINPKKLNLIAKAKK